MTHTAEIGLLVSQAGAVLYLLLGGWIFTLKPRRRQTTLLGAYAITFGLVSVPAGVLVLLHVIEPGGFAEAAIQGPIRALTWAIALALALYVPDRLEELRLLVPSLGLGAVISAMGMSYLIGWSPFGQGAVSLLGIIQFVNLTVGFAAAILLALRAHPDRTTSRAKVTQLALLTLAFAAFSTFSWGRIIPFVAQGVAEGGGWAAIGSASGLFGWILVASLWIRGMLAAPADILPIHRATALGILALAAAGAMFAATVPSSASSSAFVGPVIEVLGVGLLAYGILRHDLAGLDAKVEWGVSKTTVGGVFVAVFFVVSEGAQALFAGFAGNEFLGVIAAGALVFAISPLQRMADRFAAKAVPGGAGARQEAERSYREAVELALTDGEITPEEEARLAEMADRLGVPSRRALEIRREVEDEAGGGRA